MNLHELKISESTVEYVTRDAFCELGFASRRGVEIDDAGERTGPETAVLAKRLDAAVRALNPALPPDIGAVRLPARPVGRRDATCTEAGRTLDN